jgi:hypothetical protein
MPLAIELPNAGSALQARYAGELIADPGFKFSIPTEDFISSGVTTTDEFESTVDGDPVVLSFKNMTINAGHIVRPKNRCKGMFIYIEGDLTINGLLTMTSRGANAPGKFVNIDPANKFFAFTDQDKYSAVPEVYVIPAVGGVGAVGVAASRPTAGNAYALGIAGGIKSRCSGGGGSGGAMASVPNRTGYTAAYAKSGNGGAGTSFSGGSGSGGATGYEASAICENAGENAGKGGDGKFVYNPATSLGITLTSAPGGAGNPGGATARPGLCAPGETGTGGLIVLIVGGKIIFGASGEINSNGSAGGAGRPTGTSHNGPGGGGSGGGSIHIFHKGTINDPTKIKAIGGNGGTSPSAPSIGGKGGNGSVNIVQI